MTWILWIVAAILFVPYAKLITEYKKGLAVLDASEPPTDKGTIPEVTVVVPFRNERHSWEPFLHAASRQNFEGNIHWIFVDDHSNDGSDTVLNELATFYNLSYSILRLPAGRQGKKWALYEGIEKANTPWVITTDADTRAHHSWIKTMASYFEPNKSLVLGPVQLDPAKGLTARLMALEFASLIGSTAAGVAVQKPIMANGANLGIRRSFFMSAWTTRTDTHLSSGDDLFLLHAAKDRPDSFSFAWNNEAMVSTDPPSSWSHWWTQRRRWAAKASYYKDQQSQWVSYLVFAYCLFLAFGVVASIRADHILGAVLWGFLAKFILDWPILKRMAKFQNTRWSLIETTVMTIIYPFLIVGVAIHSQLGAVEWKGRRTKA